MPLRLTHIGGPTVLIEIDESTPQDTSRNKQA
jgi:hypothetical protein